MFQGLGEQSRLNTADGRFKWGGKKECKYIFYNKKKQRQEEAKKKNNRLERGLSFKTACAGPRFDCTSFSTPNELKRAVKVIVLLKIYCSGANLLLCKWQPHSRRPDFVESPLTVITTLLNACRWEFVSVSYACTDTPLPPPPQ